MPCVIACFLFLANERVKSYNKKIIIFIIHYCVGCMSQKENSCVVLLKGTKNK